MKSFLQDMTMNLTRWIQGRYGNDSLSNGLVALGVIALLLSIIPGLGAFSLLSFVCLAIAIFRSLSKNFARRRKENETYERVMKGPKRTYAMAKKAWANRATTRYFKCKGCGTALSVPRGEGTLRVVCPKCKKETRKS